MIFLAFTDVYTLNMEVETWLTTLDRHPTVIKVLTEAPLAPPTQLKRLESDTLKQMCLEAGAGDVGFVSLDDPRIAGEKDAVLALFPRARTLVSYVIPLNRENIRNPARSVSNLEFHHVGEEVNEVGRRIVARLESLGARAVSTAMGFPMEMDRWPRRMWTISHKPVAVAAGLGTMGIHRNVIHPRFGSFILLGTVVTEAELTEHSAKLDYNPCVECKLCVAACPTGAIASDGTFNFAACYTHNYREFMSGFSDWVENTGCS
jgi:epoxyqueuosine reductase QueG